MGLIDANMGYLLDMLSFLKVSGTISLDVEKIHFYNTIRITMAQKKKSKLPYKSLIRFDRDICPYG